MTQEANATHPLLHVFAIRDFSLLWTGRTISLLGSQFTLIALPWLVLQLQPALKALSQEIVTAAGE